MPFITSRQKRAYGSLTLEELILGIEPKEYEISDRNPTRTIYKKGDITCRNIRSFISQLSDFNERNKGLIQELDEFNKSLKQPTNSSKGLYRRFYIPKKSSDKLRQIDAPNARLKSALTELRVIFEESFGVLHHTSAFAYTKKRSTVDCLKKHQNNNSKWFLKVDFSNFFPSTTLKFVLKMFEQVYPFSEILKTEDGKVELTKSLSLCFLKGGLPQGTPISPFLTNTMMIPFDHILSKQLREDSHASYVYTRYADDIIISARIGFDKNDMVKTIKDLLDRVEAPFCINEQKTTYGSSAGRNFHLNLMLNKDNNITVGWKNKKRMEAMLTSFVRAKKSGSPWDSHETQEIFGLLNYYKKIEASYFSKLIQIIDERHKVDVIRLMKENF